MYSSLLSKEQNTDMALYVTKKLKVFHLTDVLNEYPVLEYKNFRVQEKHLSFTFSNNETIRLRTKNISVFKEIIKYIIS